MLLLGVILLPFCVDQGSSDAFAQITIVVLGLVGIAGLVIVLCALTFRLDVPRRTTLAMICLGVVSVLGFLTEPIVYPSQRLVDFVLFVALPLFGIMHLTFLARHLLFLGAGKAVSVKPDGAT
jgi:hypothetical protein